MSMPCSLGLRFTAQRGARWQWPEGPLVGPVVLRRPCYRWTADPGPAMAVFGLLPDSKGWTAVTVKAPPVRTRYPSRVRL